MNQPTIYSPEKVGYIALSALMLGHAAQGLTFTAFTPGLPEMAKSFNATGHGMEIAQQSVTIAALGVVVGSFLSGKIVDMIGSRTTILIMLALFGITGLGGMILSDPVALLTSRVFNGFSVACLVTACVTMMSILFRDDERSKVIGTAGAMGAAASLISLLLGGVLVQKLGWRAAFIQFPIFGLLGSVLAYFGIREVPRQVADTSLETQSWVKILPLFMLTSLLSLVMFMGSTQLAFLLPQDGISASTTISLVMGTITVFAVLSGLSFGTLDHRLGLQNTLAVGFTSCCVGLSLIGLASSLTMAFAGAALLGIYVGIAVPYPYHTVMLKTTAHARAKAIGLLGAFNFLGAFLNPFIFGPMTKAYGLHVTFLMVATFMGIFALGAFLMARIKPPRVASQQT